MPPQSLRIVVDVDEVLADTLGKELAWLRETFGHQLTPESLHGHALEDVLPAAHHAALEALQHEGDFFGDLPLMPGAREVMEALAARHEVFIATAAMEYPRSFTAKFRWLSEHFPFIPPRRLVFCGDKGILAADVLVDDSQRHLRRFRGRGLLFSAPHNAGITDLPRVDGWSELARLFLDERA